MSEGSPQGIAHGFWPHPPSEARKHRPHIDQETNEDCNRIAREAENDAITDLPETHRTSGLYRDLPKVTLADLIDGLSHMVLGALARPSRNHEHVEAGGSISQSVAHEIGIVWQDPEILRLGACDLISPSSIGALAS